MSGDGWQIDNNGKRFRMVGNIKEYAMTISTVGAGTVYQDELPDINDRLMEQKKEELKRETEALAAVYTGKLCPFKVLENKSNCKCEKKCAFYGVTGCVLSSERPAAKNTINKSCPLTEHCTELCAMYSGGCTLIDTIMGLKPGKE